MGAREILRRQAAEPDIAHAMARLVIDQWGAPIGMLLWPMSRSHMRDGGWNPSLVLTDSDSEHPRPQRSLRRVVLKAQVVLAEEAAGKVTGYIWRVESGDISVLMGQDPSVFQSLARYFGSPEA